jgi:anti-sigma regulatory factor (Ser/Thr protein kinase)
MAVVIAKPTGRPDGVRWALDGDLASLGVLRLQLRSYLTSQAVAVTVAGDVVLAVQEAAKNAVRASSGRTVSVAVWIERDAIWVCVRDAGKGFAYRGSRRCPSPWSTHGRGLCLMNALMDEVTVKRSRGTRVVMHRRLATAAA